MSERDVKRAVKGYLDSIGAYHIWPVPTGYGPKLLDCYACIKGKFVTIETKREGLYPTPSQLIQLQRINHAGGLAFASWDVDRVRKMIEDHVLGAYDYERE